MQTLLWNSLDPSEQQNALARPTQTVQDSLTEQVRAIKKAVLTDGDKALFDFAKRFDNTELTALQVAQADIDKASEQVSDTLKSAIQTAYNNIHAFHTAQIPTPIDTQTMTGVRCQVITRPIDSVGLYIPGGTAPLFSTVLMLAIPAKIAGCRQIVLCSPAPISNETLYTAKLCGIDTVYAIGGAGAVFAMAYGTDSVTKVDKIFGPGNAYVTEAKRQVLADGVAIDMPAGPSEVLVIADEFANPAFVASDLLSQAEHGADSQVILVTPSQALADKVSGEIDRQLALLSRADTARLALAKSRIIIADDLAQCIDISNIYAPEHLIINTQNPRAWLDDITHAGSVFLGAYSPESMGDYASGTNHVLPTYGFARTQSSLGLADFYKRMTVQELDKSGFLALAPTVETMAQAEQLDAHKLAVTVRVDEINS
ncbi:MULTISPECIES: histidinol dehydrogenase [Moraxella]|uniref:Histidinol dehydrogenase n=1 Tax=Moraxella lacunata TaxID=477 RepID=A0A1B8Q7Q0_MORLA|nr:MULTISPECIES: histidinol dehydrogenase [Moraxella]MBE9579916.1 histidinol dehydrogenase [Moraxella sp. K1664]MBE9589293.1 histidinol dehydrogenase [Moraxella sp. K1630]MBE9591784.1 histidinol dehydrogenase [Moraxella sp. K127]MBE9597559.1 histidinol dehydrogenase [Moraxella sp. K2450]MDH9220061.1 histidinol dehydrogenase [Moraxella lacunata]